MPDPERLEPAVGSPPDCRPGPEVSRRALGGLGVLVAALLVGGCSAGPVPRPTPTADGSVPSVVPIPEDGVSLARLGFTHGPVRAWSLPRSSRISDPVDQPNQLTMTVSGSAPDTLVAWLVEALPPAGFTIDEQRLDGQRSALVATGYGWRGSVVGAGTDRTAITLQQLS